MCKIVGVPYSCFKKKKSHALPVTLPSLVFQQSCLKLMKFILFFIGLNVNWMFSSSKVHFLFLLLFETALLY